MSPARIIILLVALVAGVGAALLISRPTTEPAPVARVESAPTVPVLVAAADIPVGNVVAAADMRWLDWPLASVPAGVVRKDEPYAGHAHGEVTVIDSSRVDVAATVRDLTGGHGADIVYNTVGEPYYEAGTKSLRHLGRQIFIASTKTTVPFDIFAFYRGKHTFFGVDSLSLSSPEAGEILRELVPGFASGALKPFPIKPDAIYPLERAAEAYVAVLGSSRDRLVFQPNG